jgi:hypothetical protein
LPVGAGAEDDDGAEQRAIVARPDDSQRSGPAGDTSLGSIFNRQRSAWTAGARARARLLRCYRNRRQFFPRRTAMRSTATQVTSKSTATSVEPALHALVAAPLVGSFVLMLVAVGIAALTVGALSGVAGRHRAERNGKREPR